jgi:methionyl-tRNA formyltransferase
MRVLFFGMMGRFSVPVLQALLASPHQIVGIVIPAQGPPPQAPFRLIHPPPGLELGGELSLAPQPGSGRSTPDLAETAWARGIPLLHLARPRDGGFLAWLADLAPDVACVACFNRIFPQEMLALPRHGVLNVHPSRLPHYRGPDPLFWQFRDGVNPVGVTVHWMDAGADTGPLAEQVAVPLGEGEDGLRAELACARAGGKLLADCLDRLAAGQLRPIPQPQGGSAQPMPGPEDFALSLDWPAWRAFHFMRGTVHWGLPYPLAVGDQTLRLGQALGWQPHRVPEIQSTAPGRAIIPFAQGSLEARLTEADLFKIKREGH